jgi:hypothetical protein
MGLVELMVATSAGTIIFAGLTMVVVGTMHQTTRVTDRVHATQEARTVVHRLVTELHSSCVAPQTTPVRAGSSGTSLSFVHQRSSQVAPKPTLTTVSLSGTTLSQSDYAWQSGEAPNWTFSATPQTRTLVTNVAAATEGGPVFSYYGYSGGQISGTPFSVPLDSTSATKTVEVRIGVRVSPPPESVKDTGASAVVQDSALLRLTPPSYSTGANNLPCE